MAFKDKWLSLGAPPHSTPLTPTLPTQEFREVDVMCVHMAATQGGKGNQTEGSILFWSVVNSRIEDGVNNKIQTRTLKFSSSKMPTSK